MGVGYGYGKIILIGDQFINYGVPAIVSAIDLRTRATAERVSCGGWTLQDNRKETAGYKANKLHQQVESMMRLFKAMSISVDEHPLHLTLDGDLVAASGLGASAASCVALGRALSEEFEKRLTNLEINDIAFEGEKAYHGTPSGVDNTASTFGGIMLFRKEAATRQNRTERIQLRERMEFVVVDSGIVVNTSAIGAFVRGKIQESPKEFEEAFEIITGDCMKMKELLEASDLRGVGELMNKYHRMIIEFGLSHERVIDLCDIAMEKGALGAKVTGGGMGGNLIALTPGLKLQERVARDFETRGLKPLKVIIGG